MLTTTRHKRGKENEIVLQKRYITADTALRLGVFFNMSPHFWMNLQSRYELENAEDHLEDKLKNEVHQYQTA
ncbi:MAG: HigA family addiction module antidote protein [Desulfobulbaceae bacterium]|nr:HigA family addiction module antidote protein [Desulfobulbaceae bacterium]